VFSLVSVASMLALAACSEDPEPVSNPREWATIPDPEGSARDQVEGVAQAQQPPRQAPRPTTPAVDTGDQRAPDRYAVRFDTTKGPVVIDVTRAWAPYGADRFYTLVREGYFTDVAFFRVVEGFMAQAGIHGDPAMNTRWRPRRIPDDPPAQSNTRGMVSYAMGGPGTRTTQFFINFVDNSRLDSMGFAPFGLVRDMAAVDALHNGYGEGPPSGRGPNQARIQNEGNAYLRAEFPQLDYIRSASIVD
jgi:peptidyl-prolyl cis-trans isomerase A (cyclophilin A)